jgi:hypothetical protein
MTGRQIWLAMALLCLVQSAEAARPARKAGTAHTVARKPAAPKRNPTAVLADALILNSVESADVNLARACSTSSAKGLLWALDGALADWDFDKGEFETSPEYDLRMSKIDNAINGDRKTIVCRSLRDEPNFIKYDADKREYEVDTYALTNNAVDEKDTGSYVSSTRMGVKARVYRSVRIDYDVDFGGSSYDFGKKFGCTAQLLGGLHFPVDPSAAQAMRTNGYVVMIGRLRQPFYKRDERSGSPTLDDPFDTYKVTLTLEFDPEMVVMVDPTGEQFPCAGPGERNAPPRLLR